jgi:hypothetical protein
MEPDGETVVRPNEPARACADVEIECPPLAHLYGPAVRCKLDLMIWR